ncbi:hypothetical protein SDC9_194470 [bioreactor metagenome]|uniref:Uncharacterized protein n=1 Tax=bioreactor metagenome TaxID=1076179 RepID=A0A645I6E2_9ZZZZ
MFAQSGMKDVDYKFERYQQENLNSKDTDLLKQNHSDRSYSERNQHNKNEENNTRREYSNIFKKANIQDEQIDDGANDILTSRYSSMMIEAYV